jgi:ubiquinone/menaquinone biosynthesis C-methylase UbiE
VDPDLARYAASRTTERGATSYETKYERELHKRISDRVERRVIARALALTGGPHERVLDVPCGAGRLSRELVGRARSNVIVEADYSHAMLVRCEANARGYTPRLARLDALNLPFPERTFDLVFSVRISHHIARPEDRERWLLELCRVSRSWVVATFFDAGSFKNLVRRALTAKRPKNAMTIPRVHELAERAGFRAVATIPLSRLFSGHRYLVLERTRAPA